METKIFSIILATVFLATVLLAGIASAADNFTVSPTELTFGKYLDTKIIKVKNVPPIGENPLTLTFPSAVTIDGENEDSITLSITGTVENLPKDSTKDLTVEIEIEPSDWDNFDLGEKYYKNVVFTNKADLTETKTVTFSMVNGFCKYGDFGKLKITELEDRQIDNEDEWDWHPFDDVEFRVEISNDFDEKKRVTVEYELLDSEGRKVDFDGDSEQSVSIADGDSEKITFSLKVPADIDSGDYKLFIKSYVKGHEDDEGCIDNSGEFDGVYYQKVTIDREDERAVIVDTDKLALPDFVTCGDLVTLYTKIYNIGEEDEDKVKVNLYNSELGVDLNEVITDLETGESATLTFNFQSPKNVKEGTYLFRLITFYEYDEDDDEYISNSKEDLDKTFDFNLKVNCVQEKKKSASITAELDSAAVAGSQLTIKGTIKNTGEEETTYSLSVAEYNSWASLNKIEPTSSKLGAGESKDFLVYLNVNEDAEGEQFFTIKADYDGETTEQEVSVVIEAQGTTAVTGAAIGVYLRENWFIWVIIAINIILIIAIILVARRITAAR